ncbi:UNVERIFIED_CONTAM: hypothetical protein RMT77_002313 [Armadillidium vulgare]
MDFNELYVDTCSSASKLASVGDAENLKKLVELGKPTNGQDNKGWRALHHACNGGHIECLKILLKAEDVDINAITFERQTALYLVCCSKLDKELKFRVAEILLEAGADPNQENKKRYVTILNQVISSCNLPLAKLLLKFKVNVNEHDDKYGSTLNAAVKSGSLEMVKLITEQRLEYNLLSYHSTNIFKFWHLAVLQKNTAILEHLSKNPQCVTKINSRDNCGRTPLLLACTEQNREGIKILLDHGADPNIKDSADMIPLLFFVENLKDEDLVSSESLFGKMVKLTNLREFKRPRYCRYSFLHRLPFYKRSVEIFSYLMEHFPHVSLRGVYAEVDHSVLLPMERETFSGDTITLSPLAYCCDQFPKHKNVDIFKKMVECEKINDYSYTKFPAIITALGNRNPDLFVIEHLIKNGASVFNFVEEGYVCTYPSSLHCLFCTPDPSPALELLFALFASPENLIRDSQYVIDAFTMNSQGVYGVFRLHRGAVLPIIFLKVVCSISKYACTKFFEESEVKETVEQLRNRSNRSYFHEEDYYYDSRESERNYKELEEIFLNILRTPKSLQRLASLRIRDTLTRQCGSFDISLYKLVEDLYKQVKLPLALKDQLLFR